MPLEYLYGKVSVHWYKSCDCLIIITRSLTASPNKEMENLYKAERPKRKEKKRVRETEDVKHLTRTRCLSENK
jgi:hypothetical protein